MDDLISRADGIEVLNKLARDSFSLADGYQYYLGALHDTADKIKELPSVQPDKDLIHLQKEQAYMQGYEDGQKSRKGKWIRWHETLEDASGVEYVPRCKCSECGKEYEAHSTRFINFCPNCGADMRQRDDER